MTESDPDSNSLRQDQPECPEHEARGVFRRETQGMCLPIGFALGDTADRTGCHRTIRADIRSRLDGGPQGRNPHFLRTLWYIVRGHKPFEGVRRESNSPRKPAAEAGLNGLPCRSLSAFRPNALYRLRASDRRRADGRFRPVVRVLSESRSTDKPVDSAGLCALVTRFLRPAPEDRSPLYSRTMFPVPKRDHSRIDCRATPVGPRRTFVRSIGERCRAAGGRLLIPRVRVRSSRVSGRAFGSRAAG